MENFHIEAYFLVNCLYYLSGLTGLGESTISTTKDFQVDALIGSAKQKVLVMTRDKGNWTFNKLQCSIHKLVVLQFSDLRHVCYLLSLVADLLLVYQDVFVLVKGVADASRCSTRDLILAQLGQWFHFFPNCVPSRFIVCFSWNQQVLVCCVHEFFTRLIQFVEHSVDLKQGFIAQIILVL